MARSAQRRNRQQRERRPTPRAAAPAARPAATGYEDTMFFPRLRRQAKWMFVFLAVVFGLGYVIFNVGGTIPGVGLGDVLQNIGQDSGGPSEGDARQKIEDEPNNPAGYLELATALQRNGKNDEAVAPLERYISFRPKDRSALGQLAGLYLSQGQREQQEAIRAQAQLTQLTGGDVFSPDPSSQFGKTFGLGQITQIEGDKITQRLNENFVEAQQAFQNATSTYKKLIAAIPKAEQADEPSMFLQLAFAATSANDLKEAIAAYKRYLAVSPDSPNAAGVREQINRLEAAQKASQNQAQAQTQQGGG